MGTFHIYFSGGVLDSKIVSITDPPDIIEEVVETGEDYEVYHEYRKLRTDPPEPPMRGSWGLWTFTGVKQRQKGTQP